MGKEYEDWKGKYEESLVKSSITETSQKSTSTTPSVNNPDLYSLNETNPDPEWFEFRIQKAI